MKAAAAASVLLLAAGCGGGDGSVEPVAPRESLTVAEALKRESGGLLLVHGTLIVVGDDVRLCSAILESHPPQCGQPSLRVVGLDLVGASNMEQAKGTAWSRREVSLVGRVEDGTLTVSAATK